MEEVKKEEQVAKQPIPATSTGKQMPTGVKVISVLQFIGVGIMWLSALMFIIGGIILLISGPSILMEGVPTAFLPLVAFGGILFLFVGLVSAGLGVLFFFIARGLWRGRNWARILTIIFQTLGILYSIFTIATGQGGYVNVVISIIIVVYLGFSKSVKEAFKNQ